MEERSVLQGEIAVIRSCASKKIPFNRSFIDLDQLLTEFLSCGKVLSPLHYDETELVERERELMKKCSCLSQKIDDIKSTVRSMVDAETFTHVYGFVERMINHVKKDVGKFGTKASDGATGTNEA